MGGLSTKIKREKIKRRILTKPQKDSLTAPPEVHLLDLGQDFQRAVLPEDGAGERLLVDGQLRVGLKALPNRSSYSRTTTKECLM